MKEYRYGTFRLADNLRPLTAICIFVLFSVMSTVLNLSFFFTLVPALLAFLYAWQIIQLHREQFVLRSDSILVFMGRKTSFGTKPNHCNKTTSADFLLFQKTA